MEEIKYDPKNIIFATLTFSEESLKSQNMTTKNQTKHLKKQSAYSGNVGGKNTNKDKDLGVRVSRLKNELS